MMTDQDTTNSDTLDVDIENSNTKPRTSLFTRSNLAKVGLVLVAGTGIALIINYLLDDPSTANFRDLQIVCVENPDEMHSFVITKNKLIKHLRSRKPIACPECGSLELARSGPCVSCGLAMPLGVHNLPPDNCPHCGIEQPSPTIGDHVSIHAPGAHGEETVIVPLMEDAEPE